VAETYDNIGSTYSSRNDFNRALEYHEKALNIKMRVLGTKDDDDNDDHNSDDDDHNSDDDDDHNSYDDDDLCGNEVDDMDLMITINLLLYHQMRQIQD
jgi:hypothetical protein